MRARTWIIIASVGLNLFLAAGWYSSWIQNVSQTPFSVRRPLLSPQPAVKTNIVVRHANFLWSQVESTNYYAYINNLREIACPEPTIRNIIMSEINQLYIRRRQSEVQLPEQQWWRSTPDPEMARETLLKIKALEDERQALLTKLLGDGWQTLASAQLPALQSPGMARLLGSGWELTVDLAPAPSASGISLTGPLLGEVAAATRPGVYDLAARARVRIETSLQSQILQNLPVDKSDIAKIELEERNQLVTLLTADQYQEFLLRYSQTAQLIRDKMASLSLAPEQFRSLFEVLDPIQSQPVYYYHGADPDLLAQQQQLQAQTEAAMKQGLGDAAYAAYKLSVDPLYVSSRATARQIDAPPETVMPLYEISRATQAELDRIRNDATLSDDDKVEALANTEVEQHQAVAKLLGPEAFQRWLKAQSRSPQNAPSPPAQPPTAIGVRQ
jgi:hypothetical protein